MKDLLILIAHLITTVAKLLGKGGARSIVANNLLIKQQLLIVRRQQRRSPRLTPIDQFLLSDHNFSFPVRFNGLPSLLKFHGILSKPKYRLLYSSDTKCKPGPKHPSKEIIDTVLALKQRNPRFTIAPIAQSINQAFGTSIDKYIVRRIFAAHNLPDAGCDGSIYVAHHWL